MTTDEHKELLARLEAKCSRLTQELLEARKEKEDLQVRLGAANRFILFMLKRLEWAPEARRSPLVIQGRAAARRSS